MNGSPSVLSRLYSAESASVKKVEDVMPIDTEDKREEIEAELEESPYVIKSYDDERPVGCTGGEGEDEHDVVWFSLKKGTPYECPECSQYFVLEW